MARQSYFAEMRNIKNDPNFFNRMGVDEIKKNVKRIIRDIKFDNIDHRDYMYFTNAHVLTACMDEAHKQYESASVLVNSLNFYINECLKNGHVPYKTTDVNIEHARASNEQLKQNDRCYIWGTIYNLFQSIYNGAEVQSTLKIIQTMDFNVNVL
jgi:hypothetical protein